MADSVERITRLIPHPTRGDVVRIERNGMPWVTLSLSRVAELAIQVGEPLTEGRIAQIERAAALDRALEVALRLLAVRPRSRAEVVRRLRRKDVSDDVVAEALERLERLGYLDDEAFARSWIAHRMATHPRGPSALRAELRSKGVASDIIDEVLSLDRDEELVAARAVAAKHWSRLSGLAGPVAQRRLIGVLQRRGFSWEVIRRVVQEMVGQVPDREETDDEGHGA